MKYKTIESHARTFLPLNISAIGTVLCVDREVEIHEQQQRKCISYYRPHENPDDLCVCAAEVRQEMLDQKTVVAYHYYF